LERQYLWAVRVIPGVRTGRGRACFRDNLRENRRIAFKGYLDADNPTGAIFTIRPDGTHPRQITFPDVGTVDDQPDCRRTDR
jgi:hypothetical protein